MGKRLTLAMALLLVVVMLFGCQNDGALNSDDKGRDVAKVGIVSSSSGFGDGAFNDLALKGLDKAKSDLNISYDKVQIKTVGDIELSLRDMATTGDYDLIIGLTYESIEAMKTIASEFPEQKFALVDASMDASNVACYLTKDEEGSYLVGVAAALMKKNFDEYGLADTDKVGFIGGKDLPNIRVFHSGYAAGVKSVDKNTDVVTDFVGSFKDVTSAKEIAISMHRQGADTIYHAAGMSGNGLFQASKENNAKAFGVNINQNSVEPTVVAGSMIKNVDVEVFTAIQSVVDDKFQAGVIKLGLAENGVGLVTEGSQIELGEEILSEIDKCKEDIISGKIKVPTTSEELSIFIDALD